MKDYDNLIWQESVKCNYCTELSEKNFRRTKSVCLNIPHFHNAQVIRMTVVITTAEAGFTLQTSLS